VLAKKSVQRKSGALTGVARVLLQRFLVEKESGIAIHAYQLEAGECVRWTTFTSQLRLFAVMIARGGQVLIRCIH
jgi:hypothetical protein